MNLSYWCQVWKGSECIPPTFALYKTRKTLKICLNIKLFLSPCNFNLASKTGSRETQHSYESFWLVRNWLEATAKRQYFQIFHRKNCQVKVLTSLSLSFFDSCICFSIWDRCSIISVFSYVNAEISFSNCKRNWH